MANAQSNIPHRYQQPMWGRVDRTLRNCFTGSAILGVAVLILVFVAPTPPPEPASVEQMPERFARLILEKARPAAPVAEAAEQIPVVEAPRVETPPATPKPPPRRRPDREKVAEDRGVKGRQKAQQDVAQNLTEVTGSLDKVLDNLSKSLPASETPKGADDDKSKRRRRRGVRSGRSSEQLASVEGVESSAAPDISKSAIVGDGISVAAISDLTVEGDGDGGAPVATGAGGGGSRGGGGEYRSNESLLGVVRRYAPGIQFCYDNELKKNPGLRGKLVVSLTVLANGRVGDVSIVEDRLGSSRVRDCVVSQIRGWQFPTIPEGACTFKTPFVFTPPE